VLDAMPATIATDFRNEYFFKRRMPEEAARRRKKQHDHCIPVHTLSLLAG
jgi:hypothetical protein